MVTNTNYRHQATLATGTDVVSTLIHIQDADHLKVIRTRDGADTTLTRGAGADYTVSNVGVSAGSTVTFIGQQAGDIVTIKRNVPLTQLGRYIGNNAFPPETNEDGHDKSRMIDQQIQEEMDRQIVFPESEVFSSSDQNVLPVRAARLTTLYGFDGAGDPTVYTPDEVISLVTGIGRGRRSYSVGAGGTVSPCIEISTASNTGFELEVIGYTEGEAGGRRRRWNCMNLAGTLYLSDLGNITYGKSGSEKVDFSAGAAGTLLQITLDGTALTSTQTVNVRYELKPIKTLSDATAVFKP